MLEVPSANKNRSQRCSGSPYLRMTPSPVHMNNKSKFFKPAKQISEFDVLEDDDAPKVRVQSARARKSDEAAFLFKNEEQYPTPKHKRVSNKMRKDCIAILDPIQ